MFLPFRSASQFLVSHLRPYPRQPTFYRLLTTIERNRNVSLPIVFTSLPWKRFFDALPIPTIVSFHLVRFCTRYFFAPISKLTLFLLLIKRGCRDRHRKLRQCTNRRRYIFLYERKYLKKEIIILVIKNKRNYFNLSKTFSVRLFTFS